jgi:hypothetical protein
LSSSSFLILLIFLLLLLLFSSALSRASTYNAHQTPLGRPLYGRACRRQLNRLIKTDIEGLSWLPAHEHLGAPAKRSKTTTSIGRPWGERKERSSPESHMYMLANPRARFGFLTQIIFDTVGDMVTWSVPPILRFRNGHVHSQLGALARINGLRFSHGSRLWRIRWRLEILVSNHSSCPKIWLNPEIQRFQNNVPLKLPYVLLGRSVYIYNYTHNIYICRCTCTCTWHDMTLHTYIYYIHIHMSHDIYVPSISQCDIPIWPGHPAHSASDLPGERWCPGRWWEVSHASAPFRRGQNLWGTPGTPCEMVDELWDVLGNLGELLGKIV